MNILTISEKISAVPSICLTEYFSPLRCNIIFLCRKNGVLLFYILFVCFCVIKHYHAKSKAFLLYNISGYKSSNYYKNGKKSINYRNFDETLFYSWFQQRQSLTEINFKKPTDTDVSIHAYESPLVCYYSDPSSAALGKGCELSGGHFCRRQKHRPIRQARQGKTLFPPEKGFPHVTVPVKRISMTIHDNH